MLGLVRRRLRKPPPPILYGDLVWQCHVCLATRPDDKISVFSRTRMIKGVEVQENIRHCNDRVECIEGAGFKTWMT